MLGIFCQGNASVSKTKQMVHAFTEAATLITAAVLALLFIGCQNAVKTKLVVQISLFCFYW
jgi:hypothetical protein